MTGVCADFEHQLDVLPEGPARDLLGALGPATAVVLPLAAEGRSETALAEHKRIVDAIAAGDGAAADKALRQHISMAWETRLKLEAAADRD